MRGKTTAATTVYTVNAALALPMSTLDVQSPLGAFLRLWRRSVLAPPRAGRGRLYPSNPGRPLLSALLDTKETTGRRCSKPVVGYTVAPEWDGGLRVPCPGLVQPVAGLRVAPPAGLQSEGWRSRTPAELCTFVPRDLTYKKRTRPAVEVTQNQRVAKLRIPNVETRPQPVDFSTLPETRLGTRKFNKINALSVDSIGTENQPTYFQRLTASACSSSALLVMMRFRNRLIFRVLCCAKGRFRGRNVAKYAVGGAPWAC